MGVYDTDSQEYNTKLAEALKKIPEFEQPKWAEYAKTGPAKARPIDEPDFWNKRAASILRQIYKRKTVGVNRLRTRYGSKKNRGYRPEHFMKAGGKIIRTILQQADKAEFTEMVKPGRETKKRRLGRQLTKKGIEFLESVK